MAYYGLSKPYFAKLNLEAGTYSEGFRCGKAVGTDITPNYIEASLYGDDELAEYVKEFKDADVNVSTTEMPLEAASVLFGHKVDKEKSEITYGADDQANYVGYGTYMKEVKDGVVKYPAVWLPKVKFSDSAESFTTKGDSITFVTPNFSGKASTDATGNWRYKKTFDTEEEAIAWLEEKVNIAAA